MADPTFRSEQWAQRYAPHVEPLNRLVDGLVTKPGEGTPPYVAPHYRPDQATMIGLLSDPGPAAGGWKGSGFLSYRNNDQTAERLGTFLLEVGVDPDTVIPWNAYPWFVHEPGAGKAPTVAMIRDGLRPLRQLLELVPSARVVVAIGRVAGRSVQMLENEHGRFLAARGVTTMATYHTSRQALQCKMGSPELNRVERERREDHIRDTLRAAKKGSDRSAV